MQEGGLGELKYPLLADYKKEVARNYDVLLESEGVPLRGLFIIDKQGILRQKTVNDLPVGRSVDEVLRLVKAFQFSDEHGEGKAHSKISFIKSSKAKLTRCCISITFFCLKNNFFHILISLQSMFTRYHNSK